MLCCIVCNSCLSDLLATFISSPLCCLDVTCVELVSNDPGRQVTVLLLCVSEASEKFPKYRKNIKNIGKI